MINWEKLNHWFDKPKFSWPIILLTLTKKQVQEALSELPPKDREEILAEYQNKQNNTWAEKVEKGEQYEQLKPAGFEHAPQSAKQKWKELADSKNVEKLQWIHENVSYNADHTMNILKLKKTFCEDISGQNEYFTFAQAQKLGKTNAWWYKLMTDYNDTDSDQKKMQTDRYKVINIFSWDNGDTYEWMCMFRDMAGCNSRYWTATPYKDEKWKIVKGVVRSRLLYKIYCSRDWYHTNYCYRVCGFKDSM